MAQKSFSVLLSRSHSPPFSGGVSSGVAARCACANPEVATNIRASPRTIFFIDAPFSMWPREPSGILTKFSRATEGKFLRSARPFDLRAVTLHVRGQLDVRQGRGQLALRAVDLAGLVVRHGDVVAVRLFPRTQRARPLKRHQRVREE